MELPVTFLERGPGLNHGRGGHSLTLLHGIGGGAALFEPQLDALSDRRRVVAWNMPGYGDSPAIESLTFEALSEALGSLIAALGPDPVDLFGHSIGGMVIQEYLARGGTGVRTAVLCCTTAAFGSRDGSFQESFVRARLEPLDRGLTMAELARSAIPGLLGETADAKAAERAIAAMSAVSPAAYRASIRCLASFDRRAELAAITVPTLLLAGERDAAAPTRTMARMAEKIPAARLEVVPDAGHLLPLEHPDATNRIVGAFLDSL